MTQVVCANCGQVLRPTDKFCYNCGAKVVPIKMTSEVKAEEPKPETIRNIPRKPAPAETQEERPKFHMDENMSWNTDGYPEAQKHTTEEANFTWADASAQDRIRKRQEEGRRALYEEQQAREVAKAKALAEETSFDETPEADEVVKAVEAESIIPAEEISKEEPAEVQEAIEAEVPAAEPEEAPEAAEAEAPAEEPEEAPEVAEAEAPAEETPVPAPVVIPAPVTDDQSEPEADDDYVVPTIESIEADAEAAKAKEVEKEIFGYTIDDVDANNGKGPEVIDKFYTYSKKNEEFQELLDQENDKLKNNRPEISPETKAIRDELEQAEVPVEEEKPLTEEEAGGFVGVQLPETPMEADASESESKSDFLDGNFGKYDSYAQPEAEAEAEPAAEPEEAPAEEPEEPEEKPEEGSKVAAAAGTVAASAALAAIAEKAKARAAEAELRAEDADEQLDDFEDKAEEIKEDVEEKIEDAAEKVEEAEEKIEEAGEAVKDKAEEIKEEAEDSFDKVKEEAGEIKEEAEDSFDKAKEAAEETAEKAGEEAEEDHKLTYQEVFSGEAERTQKHTFLKIIAILILLLIILEVVAILIRRFAPDSAAGLQIQQIYEMLFSRFTGQ